MDIKYALMILAEMEAEWYNSPSTYYGMRKIDFKIQSFKHSAIEELRIYLLSHIDSDVRSAIIDFMSDVDDFASSSKNETMNLMFSTYYEVANDVLDVLTGAGV